MTNRSSSAPSQRSVRVAETADAATAAARALVVECAERAIAERGRFAIALSGGATPQKLHASLVTAGLDWTKVLVFFGDERCVPPEHADSNYRLARESLLSKIAIPGTNVHRIYAESPDKSAAAIEYARELVRVLGDPQGLSKTDDVPRLDLVMLGLGGDGHTASLFPGSSALKADRELVVATWVERLATDRITLTARTINAARAVVFLVTGADKAGIVKDVLEGPFVPAQLPSQLIAPVNGAYTWLLDRAAATQLDRAS